MLRHRQLSDESEVVSAALDSAKTPHSLNKNHTAICHVRHNLGRWEERVNQATGMVIAGEGEIKLNRERKLRS